MRTWRELVCRRMFRRAAPWEQVWTRPRVAVATYSVLLCLLAMHSSLGLVFFFVVLAIWAFLRRADSIRIWKAATILGLATIFLGIYLNGYAGLFFGGALLALGGVACVLVWLVTHFASEHRTTSRPF